ncbi:MAG: hypothetical protein GY787_18150 [Alteromonadales bacterium]|nr:hypothetical protein [Alteromonadales bacterium]
MAQIITYPKLSTLANNDLLLVSDVSSKFKTTNSLEVDTLAQHIITTNNVITGSGTSGRIPKWLPDGSLGDSFIKQEIISASNVVTIDGGGGFINILKSDQLKAPDISTNNITAAGAGNVILQGGVIIGDQPTDILQITSQVSDSTGTGSTGAGEILVSNASGQLVWNSSGSTYTWDLAANTGVPQAIASGGTVTIVGGTNISTQVNPPFLGDTQVLVDLDDSVTLAGTLTVNGDAVIGDAGTDTLTVNAETTFTDDVIVNGNLKGIKMGLTSPLNFLDSGGSPRLTIGGNITTNSIINESGAGDLILISNTELEIKSGELGENFAKFTKDGPIELYYDNVKKFETTSSGAKIPTAGEGLQLVSPNGTVYTVTVDNSGNLTVT